MLKSILKDKFLITVIILSVIIVGTSCFISLLGYSSYVRNIFGFIISPFQEFAVTVNEKIDSLYESKKEYEELKQKNEELESQLREANENLHKAKTDSEENKWLKEYLNIKDTHTDFSFCDAKVTAEDKGIFTLNKGSIDGAEPGMAVINEYGLVGKITEVGSNFSKMSIITHTSFSAGVLIEECGDNGVLSGDFSLYEQGLAVISYLPSNTNAKVGDRIITSGLGSTFPEGLVIGEITQLIHDEYQREVKAYVKPCVSAENINKVMIITAYEKKPG